MTGEEARYNFYKAQYARFAHPLAAEIRREIYGVDIGQQGWRTMAEQTEINELIGPGDASVLDIACGSGGPTLALMSERRRLTGVDVEEPGIDQARRQAVQLGFAGQTSFLAADCNQTLPFADGSFDVILCVDAWNHLSDRSAILSDWARLLALRGRVWFTDSGVFAGPATAAELAVRGSQGDFYFCLAEANQSAIQKAGLRLVDRADRTASVADVASKTHHARASRQAALIELEGQDWFDKRQTFLSVTANLARTRRLLRIRYIAEAD